MKNKIVKIILTVILFAAFGLNTKGYGGGICLTGTFTIYQRCIESDEGEGDICLTTFFHRDAPRCSGYTPFEEDE